MLVFRCLSLAYSLGFPLQEAGEEVEVCQGPDKTNLELNDDKEGGEVMFSISILFNSCGCFDQLSKLLVISLPFAAGEYGMILHA